ncbi:RNA 2'-phosphotransferase [Mycobacterium xenopi]|uniref:RNA 2'-phosphotransferase n=2 Tax=Mycobacterium xenopi TaxID=1789 RepID=A0AAD1H1W9_MYCXE|nr:RNA 2'-phosphotransferase [Mycobacterium xenopi]MDA3639435.1 RNA 2'-phosphotransferase [Mycobacterium xenopi]MDA3658287.1 RNA 2'-phosphotransferase [Mycobacterium xenopi]MDA3662042.1 RNA 2'-phosphotransferase [Mycobacterium xenopi]SPX89056.1 RNA 2'-phospho transferase [Mycobacterium xenopi]BBU23412.1 hypothetical protein MYXE_32020 [Mycobacterium xenopi]
MAGEFVQVDPAAVAAGSTHLEASVGDAAINFMVHEDQLADAAPGWIGESAKALSEVMTRWETRHAEHKRSVGGLSYHMAMAGTAFTANEGHSAQELSALDPR